MTIDKFNKDLFIEPASRVLSPVVPVLFCRSDPAKSIIWKTLFWIFALSLDWGLGAWFGNFGGGDIVFSI